MQLNESAYKASSRFSTNLIRIILLLAVVLFFFSSCMPIPPTTLTLSRETVQPSETLVYSTPSATVSNTFVEPTSRPSTPTAIKADVWISPGLPNQVQEEISLPSFVNLVNTAEQADIQITINQGQVISRWVYVVVSAFPNLVDQIELDQLKDTWTGRSKGTDAKPILVDSDTHHVFNTWWGTPDSEAVKILSAENLVKTAWERPYSLAIIPFNALEPRWKVLELDGQSPLRNDFNIETYPLSVPITQLTITKQPRVQQIGQIQLPESNYFPNKLTSVILTGVTALVRGTAITMDNKGITYPGEAIRHWLVNADILHISNEIPFFDGCPEAVMYPDEIRFCSPPEFIGLLEDIGTDVVELTGDHFGDYGTDAMLQTLKLYQDRNWHFYGGGYNLQNARQAVLLEHNGNHIAFIGCNAKGIGYYATASDSVPGAVLCDFDWLTGEISRLRDMGYIVITTFQHNEYYTYRAQSDLVRDFHLVSDAGAVIVSGSQAHQPHGMEFYDQSFIHYGLGNLFFDQYRFFPGPELDFATIDRHFIYDGRHIQTELLTIKFVDLAQSRPTTQVEKDSFLTRLFEASGW